MNLRARLLASVAAVVLIALAATGALTYVSLRSYLIGQLSQALHADATALGALLAGTTAPSAATVGAVAPGAFVQLRSRSGQPLLTVSAVDAGGHRVGCRIPPRLTSAAPSGPPPGGPVIVDAAASVPGGSGFRLLSTRLADGRELLVALPLGNLDRTLRHLLAVEVGVGALALLPALAIGWALVRRSMRPLAEIGRTAALIAAGDIGQRAPGGAAPTEVGRVAAAFNTMLDRIQAALAAREASEADLRRSEARLRRFVGDASHELRTPLAAVSAYSQLLDRALAEDPAVAARAAASIGVETSRMSTLVDELLLLARLDEGRPLDLAGFELVDVVTEAVSACRAVDPDRAVEVHASGPVELVGDRLRVRQVVDNLLSNVRGHTPPGTTATVRIGSQGPWASVQVSDEGPGIPPEDLTRIFDRFVRVDPSRSRRSGGSGLGLAIARAIARAHGGELVATNRPGHGAAFCLWLPVEPVAGGTGPAEDVQAGAREVSDARGGSS